MATAQDRELRDLVQSCGDAATRAQDFIRYLGFPVKQGERASGYAKFDDPSGQIEKLYKCTNKMQNELFDAYDTAEDLRDAALHPSEDQLEKVTSEMLTSYGRSIWNADGHRLTRLSDDYPKFLVFENAQDFQRYILLSSCTT